MLYLLHFNTPYRHARHYLGYTTDELHLLDRLQTHRLGTGARLLQVIGEAGIRWQLARVWPSGDRHAERRIKNTHGLAPYCPLCNPASAYHHAPIPASEQAQADHWTRYAIRSW
jgi:hypothetical protein